MADKDDAKGEGAINEARERFKESEDATSLTRQDAYDDIRFARLADQWPDAVRKQRIAEGRPCLTINKLPAFVKQVVNDSRQNKPGIKVSPVDSGADVQTAEVIGGIIRSVERRSNAEVAYDTAIDHAVSGGFGFFRIGIDYVSDDSFDLECRIDRVPNPFMVHWDPSSTKFDASDWDYAFVSDWLTEDEFEARYPKARPVSFEGDYRDQISLWLEDDKVRVAEYWLRDMSKRTLYLLADQEGNLRAVRKDDLPDIAKQTAEAGGFDVTGRSDDDLIAGYLQLNGLQIVRQREVNYHTVKRQVMSGVEILEEDEWPGPTIPICPVWGEEVYLDGRRHFRSMIRDAKDPQAMFNFWRSATTELVALAPRAPWVGPEGFVPKGKEAIWQTANTRSHAYLEYARDTPAAPQRQAFAGVPAGALQEALNASDDIKSIIGIYDASLGARSNETSGRAILARQREADVSNFHFIDNLNRAIQYAGKVLVDVIPSVYSPRETIRVLGEDSKEKVVRLTQEDGGSMQTNENGERELYNLTVGTYDVTVSTGPSYATQREETRETLVEIMRAVPGSAQYIGDVLLEHMDFVGADKVAKRLQALLPPAVQAAEGIAPPQGAQQPPQPDPLEQEEKLASIEQKRAAAIANLAKAGATQLGMEHQQLEAVLNALASVTPEQMGQSMPQMGAPGPQMMPNPGQPG